MTRKNLVTHGEFPFRLFIIMCGLRIVDLVLVQSSYVPDEYWQSLEVAHKQVFGYGSLTWEWTKNIRSYPYALLMSGVFYVLKFLNFDSVEMVVLMPRVLQGLISVMGDIYFIKWVHDKRSGQYSWAFLSWVTCHFISYCSTRTLINTLDMNLTTVALYYYPWSPKSKSSIFIGIIACLCYLRPTAFIVWLPLVLINIKSVKDPLHYIIFGYLPISLLVWTAGVAIDSYMCGELTITPYNFFVLNVLENVGSHYGSQPFLWYFYIGVPGVLGLHLLPLIISFIKSAIKLKSLPRRIYYDIDCQMIVTIGWTLIVLSVISHKEFRFLMPLIPMMLFMSSGVLSRWSSNAKIAMLYTVGIVMILTSFSTVLYLGRYHNVGTLETSKYLSSVCQNETNTKLLYLTPCHSLPMYSHLHANVSAEYLTCLPNFHNVSDYKDEADRFFDNPRQFLREKYSSSKPCTLPTHIITYDSLNITNFLHVNNYNLIKVMFNSYIFPHRTSQLINVYKRKGELCNP